MKAAPLLALALGLAHATAQAACFNPFGCAPATLEECLSEASKRPTPQGVYVAVNNCNMQFRSDLAAREAEVQAKQQAESERIARVWVALDMAKMDAASLQDAMGRPAMVLGPSECSKNPDGKRTSKSVCYTHMWRDDRAGRSQTYFEAEVVDLKIQGYERQPVWVWWTDSKSYR